MQFIVMAMDLCFMDSVFMILLFFYPLRGGEIADMVCSGIVRLSPRYFL